MSRSSSRKAPRAADAIVNYAEKNGIDLIVIGNKGAGAVERFLIGSGPRSGDPAYSVLGHGGQEVESSGPKALWRHPENVSALKSPK